MKIKKLLLSSVLFFSLHSLSAQITITNADMPNLNDNILISVNTSLANFHPDSTGANFLWDYSKLIPDSQRHIQFVSAASTPYALPFSLPTYSNFGVRNYSPYPFPWSIIGSAPTNVYDFYKKSNTAYTCTGEPLTEGTTAIPLPYAVADRVYAFPMNYLNKDSSNSVFSLPNITGLGAYVKKQKRVNEVDGWGILKTPYGTFNALRIKTTLTITDSVYIDTVHFGFTVPRAIAYEYKWFSQGSKIPMLEIDANAAGTGITIVRANWRDSLMITPTVTLTAQNTCPVINEGSLTANVSGGRYPLTYLWSNGQTTSSINNLAPGTYSVTITDRYGRVIHAVDSVKALTDSSCLILVNFTSTKTCPMAKDGSLSATETGGRNPVKYMWSTGDTTTTVKNLSPGNYDLTVTDKFGRQVTATGTVDAFVQDLACLNIPSAFTPDGDGTNDVWRIRTLSEFTNCKVEIFNQWGSIVFKSTGYNTPWDGKYNGEPVPAGAYYYIIDLDNNTSKYTGTVTIVK